MRLSGLMSGMDTESIISQLVEAKRTKVNKTIKAQKSLNYKMEAWKTLNTQIKKLHTTALSNMRFESSFIKKVTKVSNSDKVSVITGEGAMNSVQSLQVNELAKSGYLTSGDLNADRSEKVTGDTKLSELDGFGVGDNGTLQVKVGNEVTGIIQVDGNTTISSFVNSLKGAGVNANFDAANGRIYVAAKNSGTKNDFNIIASDSKSLDALKALKMSYSNDALREKYESDLDGIKLDDPDAATQLNDLATDRATARKDALVDNMKNLLDKQEDLFVSMSTDMALWSEVQTQLSNKGVTASITSVDDYNQLSDGDKAAFQEALSAAVDERLKNTSLSDTEKERLNTLKSDWDSNASSMAAIKGNFETDGNGKIQEDGNGKPILTQAAKTSIETNAQIEVNKAAALLNDYNALVPSAKKDDARDAEISLNGVTYTSDKNTFEINGLTLMVNAKTDPNEEITITTEDDTEGIYDMIKNFFKEYNALINQMDKFYNADSAKEYEPLLDEEKEAMSESEIEEWETKIKDSILRKDSTLSTFSTAMKQIMMEGVEVDGKKMYLSNFGINTLSYFVAPENEKNAYHIDGDPDDAETSGNADKLKSMIANDPDTVVSFFTQLSKNLYNKMSKLMEGTEYSSSMTVYDDKKMKTEYDDYTAKIKELEDKLADYEDKWYAKFAAMETALAKMQQNASAVTSLLGGNTY